MTQVADGARSAMAVHQGVKAQRNQGREKPKEAETGLHWRERRKLTRVIAVVGVLDAHADRSPVA